MPFNIKDETPEITRKMESCVAKTMKEGKSEKDAIAICKSSITKAVEEPKENKEPKEDKKLAEVITEGKGILKGVEICREGEYNGNKYTAKLFSKWVDKFNKLKEDGYKPPFHIGHNKPDDDGTKPALGLISNLYTGGKKIFADLEGLADNFLDKAKEYPYRSLEARIDDGHEELKSLALLGAVVPAVKNAPVTLSEKDVSIVYLAETKEQDLTDSKEKPYSEAKVKESINNKGKQQMADKKEAVKEVKIEGIQLKDSEVVVSKTELKELKEAKELVVKLEEEKKTTEAEAFVKENVQCSEENVKGFVSLVKKLNEDEKNLIASVAKKVEVKTEEVKTKKLSENDTKILSGEIMEGGKKKELSEDAYIADAKVRSAERAKLSGNTEAVELGMVFSEDEKSGKYKVK